MQFDRDIYYGNIVRGDLRGAIGYVRQFPEQAGLYGRFMERFEYGQDVSWDLDAELNGILSVYQQYYRDVFYRGTGKAQAADRLRDRLAVLLGFNDDGVDLGKMEQERLPTLFAGRGLHFMGGMTNGYYGPYVWRSTETVSNDVELPDGIRTYPVKLLDGFLARSWIDYLSFGQIGPGGWTDGDGIINCIKSAWDLESEAFRVSLLKHEAQHARDLKVNPQMSSEDLEYRAKLVELIYSGERNLLTAFTQEADGSDRGNGHAMAAQRIVRAFAQVLGVEKLDPAAIGIGTVQQNARMLFEKSRVSEDRD